MKKCCFLFPIFLMLTAGNAQIINFSDGIFKSKLLASSPDNYVGVDFFGNGITIDVNSDGEIDQSEANLVYGLELYDCDVANIEGIVYFANLTKLWITNTLIAAINVSSMPVLTYIACNSNAQLATLNVDNCANLKTLICHSNMITSLQSSGLNQLLILDCSDNHLAEFSAAGMDNLQSLKCSDNQIVALEIQNLQHLITLDCNSNMLSSVSIDNNSALETIKAANNELTSLNLNNLPNLKQLMVSHNQLDALNANGFPNLVYLDCNYNHLSSLVLHDLLQFQGLYCNNNQLAELQLQNLPALSGIDCSYNQLTALSVNTFVNLGGLICEYNQINSLDVTGTALVELLCGHNQLTTLNVTGLSDLLHLRCENNLLTILDCNTLYTLEVLICDDNHLTRLYIKNGHNEGQGGNGVHFANNPDMQYLCVDPTQYYFAQQRILFYGYINCTYGSDCDALAAESFKSDAVSVYPNPTNSNLTIGVDPKITVSSINIYNTLGQLVEAQQETGNQIITDVSGLQKGTYFISVNSDSGIITSKFIRN